MLSMFHEALGVWQARGHLRKQVEERGGGFHLSAAISCVCGRLNEVNRLLCVPVRDFSTLTSRPSNEKQQLLGQALQLL